MLADKQEELFEQWFEDHKGLILKVIRANAAAPEDQNDLFQEIAFQIWRSIPAFQGRSKASTWIYRVALNTAMLWHRTQRKQRNRCQPLYEAAEISGPTDDPSQSLETQEKMERLYGEIRKLPKVDRSLALLYLESCSYKEIAEILGISISLVGVKVNRLKKHLGRLAKGESDES